MICVHCRIREHTKCPGRGWCDCQHRDKVVEAAHAAILHPEPNGSVVIPANTLEAGDEVRITMTGLMALGEGFRRLFAKLSPDPNDLSQHRRSHSQY